MKSSWLLFVFVGCVVCSESRTDAAGRSVASATNDSIVVAAQNPVQLLRQDEAVEIPLASLLNESRSFNVNSFFVTSAGKEIPSQLDNSSVDEKTERLLFLASFGPDEKKSFVIHWAVGENDKHSYSAMTQASLGVKVDYKKVNGYYAGGRFMDVDSVTVPSDHFAHDALYRIEGPGWESDKIVYRFYLDSRNRNDIFGKRTHDLVLQKIGLNDLVSDSKESYTQMLDWGMDIFKVGESLGIGSIAMWRDSKVVAVSDVGQIKCRVLNGPIRSAVSTKYSGWKVGDSSYDLSDNVSISASSRLTKVNASVSDSSVYLCTGLAKHEGCDRLVSSEDSNGKWAYVALYGKQSLSGDNLGIAIIYKKADKVILTEDSLSEIVVLRQTGSQLSYYFGAAWEKEPGGIINEGQFKDYLDETILKLDNPIEISFLK